MIKKMIVGDKPDPKTLFLWNMIGSTVYAFASLILTYMTIRIVGEVDGGIFGIALTLAQMFIYIAYFEMRNFQVTDPEDKYTFAEYHMVKIINCMLMMVVCVAYVFVKKYDATKLSVVLMVCLYRMLDGYADVYEAEFHKRGRLDLAGKSMAFRTIISVGIYFATLILTHDILVSVTLAFLSGVVGILIFNVYVFDIVGRIHLSFSRQKIIEMWKDCFPLFIGMFLWTYLLSASRIAVDNAMASEYQSYYQVLFLPVSVINLLAGFLIRPSLLQLTELYSNDCMKEFWDIIKKMLVMLVGFTVICMIGAYVIGIPVLELIVACNLREYRSMFVFLIFSGGINAVGYIMYYVLTIFRKRRSIVLGYAIASLVALLISTEFTKRWGLWGASISYMVAVSVLAIVFVVCIKSNDACS